MVGKWNRFCDAVEKGAVGTVEVLGKSTTATVMAVYKGTAATLQVVQRGTESAQNFTRIEGHRLSILNGIIGDTLAARGSELAIEMELFGRVSGRKLCIFVHGLCDYEGRWLNPEHPERSFGNRLHQDLGYTPLYLRYNSGLHISTNGRQLNRLLSKLCSKASDPIEEIIFIGHSMGGLVVRSACHYGETSDAPWIQYVKKIIFLGTPHHGNDYEKLGNLASAILKTIPNLVTKAIAGIGNKRSAGIKDLRFGYLVDEDWQGHNADAFWRDNRHPVPLMKSVDYYIIAGSLARDSDNIFTQYFGDGLIPHWSASGRSFAKSKQIPFPEKHFKTVKGVSHMGLTRSRRVYRQIRQWCASRP